MFNIGTATLQIQESNLHFPQINKNELISGLFNPEGILKLTDHFIQKYTENYYSGVKILNNIIDFSLDQYSNYTMSEENKEAQKVSLYSTMQELRFSLIMVNSSPFSIFKLSYEYTIDGIDINQIASKYCIKLEVVHNKNNNYLIMTNHIDVIQMRLRVDSDPKCRFYKEHINWTVHFADNSKYIKASFKLIFDLIPTPNKLNRILIDRYHNLYYPFDGIIPRDNLLDSYTDYDWTYENIETNYYNVGIFNHI
jgi:hypothetical protein